MAEAAIAAESELKLHARVDRDRCCGYFPALAGLPGILSALPACGEFAARIPQITYAGAVSRFNFLRLSLIRQSTEPSYHLDSDAETAISGDPALLRQRRILRLVLNPERAE